VAGEIAELIHILEDGVAVLAPFGQRQQNEKHWLTQRRQPGGYFLIDQQVLIEYFLPLHDPGMNATIISFNDIMNVAEIQVGVN
jgi:hypothetical protein